MTYDGFHHYIYDAEGNQLQVDPGQSSAWKFVFDALNRRVRSQTTGLVSDAIFDPAGRLISAWSTPTTPQESHIYADGLQLAYRSGDGQTYFVHQNWMGTDRVHTDRNGATGAVYTSLPFGDGGVDTVAEQYAGWDFAHFGVLDVDFWSDTYHAQFRNYSPTQGRWLSPDPYDGSYDITNPQSFNRYTYVLINPLTNTDPTGQECVWDDGSFDSADDPQTGSAAGCAGQGGTYVNPDFFENAMLTNKKESNTKYGDWSASANATLTQSWVDPSIGVSGNVSDVPMSGATTTFSFSGMTQDEAIAMFEDAGFINSPADTSLSRITGSHPGINLRGTNPVCSIHLNILPESGQNGKPVTGQFHTDLFSPLLPGTAVLNPELTAAHATADVIPDLLINRVLLPQGWTGNHFCKQ